MKRLITCNSGTKESITKSLNDIRVWAYGYIATLDRMTDGHLYAVIIANDSKFEGL